jgi:2-polyprenyl-3-methyl-5-hydroxy-6-metoxy-1,4-benzoquinol methylase
MRPTSHAASGRAASDERRWEHGREAAGARGDLARDLLATALDLRGARVLDAGCGRGATAAALRAAGATVVALDRGADRGDTARAAGVPLLRGDLQCVPFRASSFHAVVLQDVIEHTGDPTRVLREITRVLTPGGVLYLSTPSRCSPVTLAADPHFGLPLLAALPRSAQRPVLRRLRRPEAERTDLAALLSWRALSALLTATGFSFTLVNRRVIRRMIDEPSAVLWSDAHRRLLHALRRIGADRLLPALQPEEPGFVHRWLSPAWYLLCRKIAV